MSTETDAAGQVGDTISVHDLASRRETLTDRQGFTYFFDYDPRGNVVTDDAYDRRTSEQRMVSGRPVTRT